MAPEIYNAYELPCKALPTDVFSLGVLFFMMAFGAPPFQSAEFSDGYFSYLKLRPGNTDFFKFHPHKTALFAWTNSNGFHENDSDDANG
jgi:serine/threonine protein kinase